MIIIVLTVLFLAAPAAAVAQLGPAPEVDRCGAEARRVARFAGRVHKWSTRRPRAQPKASLGQGVVWHVYDSEACCGDGPCSGSSEQSDALVGVVGRRFFALTKTAPDTRMVPAWEERLNHPWSSGPWSRFLRASGSLPTTPEQAVSTAWLVYQSVAPGQGLVTSDTADDLRVIEGQRARFDELVSLVRARGEQVRSRAAVVDDGYEVTLWTSRLVWFPSLRVTSAGTAGDEDLRCIRFHIGTNGTVTMLSEVAVASGVARSGAVRPTRK